MWLSWKMCAVPENVIVIRTLWQKVCRHLNILPQILEAHSCVECTNLLYNFPFLELKNLSLKHDNECTQLHDEYKDRVEVSCTEP